ncbi:MAG TPA: Tim44/TimA family putative adaptor protein [Hyphomicrobiales bacterium]|nr:Tim44/TimA family putative adaptor protein [Hyphomicrobiales bacterium]
MSSVDTIYTVILVVLALFIFWRLRAVLGTRTGNERPPSDPYSRREAAPPAAAGSENVIGLPPRGAETRPPAVHQEPSAGPAAPPAHGVAAVAAAEPGFEANAFLDGAKSAYEMIVTAFAKGDRRALRDLVSREVFDGFSETISQREADGHTVDVTFVSIDKAEIADADVQGRTAHVTVRFVSQMVSAVHDRDGKLIEGSPDKVVEVTDLWTFAREVGARDPNWTLVATQSG